MGRLEQRTIVVTKVIKLEDFNPSSSGSYTALSLAGSLFHLTSMMRTWRRNDDDIHGLDELASAIAFMIQADALSLLLVDVENELPQLALRGNHGLEAVDVSLIRFQKGEGLAGAVWESQKPLRVENAALEPQFAKLWGQETSLASMLLVPLMYEDQCLGVVTASRREVRAFYDADQEILVKVANSLAQDIYQGNLYNNAVTDKLTGLKNRFFLLEQLRQELYRIRRYQAPMTFALVDIDGLKRINQTGGREMGDRLLIGLAHRLKSELRETDLLVRFGGDEFAILLAMTDLKGAEECMIRIRDSLTQEPLMAAQPQFTMSLSVGLSSWQEADDEPLDVLERADRALSHAKKMGGGQIVSTDDSTLGSD